MKIRTDPDSALSGNGRLRSVKSKGEQLCDVCDETDGVARSWQGPARTKYG